MSLVRHLSPIAHSSVSKSTIFWVQESKPLLEIINWSFPPRAGPTVEAKCLVSRDVDKEVNKVEVVMDEVVDK